MHLAARSREDLQSAADDLRGHVVGYVRAHLDEPGLCRSSIAAAHHMSPRTLEPLFLNTSDTR